VDAPPGQGRDAVSAFFCGLCVGLVVGVGLGMYLAIVYEEER
jgi:predicted MFS family arabinose efflux permease